MQNGLFAILAFVGSGLLALEAALAHLTIDVSKKTQTMKVFIDDETEPTYVWPISTGKPGHGTPTGTFHPYALAARHHSNQYGFVRYVHGIKRRNRWGASMPYSIFFYPAVAIHAAVGSGENRHLGDAASHGCVRVQFANAKTLFEEVTRQGMQDTDIVVHDD